MPDAPQAHGLRKLLFTGIANGAWMAWARRCARTLADTGWSVQVLPLEDALAHAEGSGVRVLGTIEPPDAVLAHRIDEGAPMESILSQWSEQSGAMVRAARRAPQRWMLVAADEVAAAPDALCDGLATWLELRINLTPPAPSAATESGDPLRRCMAGLLIQTQPRWTERYEELSAACAVLDDTFAPRPGCIDISAAVTDLRALLASRRDAHEAADSLATECALAQSALDQVRQNARELQCRVDAKEAESAADLERWHAAQERIERLSLRIVDLEAQVQDGNARALEAQAQMRSVTGAHEALVFDLRRELELLAAQRDAALARASELGRLHAAELQERSLLSRRMDALLKESARQREEGVDLLARLHKFQESVERMSLEQQLSAAARDFERETGRLLPDVAEARCIAVHESGSHRHADFELLGLRSAGQELAQIAVRLVDHQGYPGLLFWGAAELDRGLSAWTPNGDEAGRPFMLLVVEDPIARRRIEALGTRDWLLLKAVAHSLMFACRFDPALARWTLVADRLCRQLEALPARLRYDALRVTQASGEHLIEAAGARFGDRCLGDSQWSWSPASRQVSWIHPEGRKLPALQSWPIDEAGLPRERYTLPLGDALTAGNWLALSPLDQELLLGVLDLLTSAAEQLPAGPGRTQAAAAAQKLRQHARHALRAMRARSIARRLMRRGAQDR